MDTPRTTASRLRAAQDFLKRPSRRWWILGGVLVVLAAAVFAHGQFARMIHSFLGADWRWMLAAIGLLLVSLVLTSLALKLIVHAYDDVRPSMLDTFSSTSIGLLANVLMPVRIGALLNPYVLFLLLRRRGARVPALAETRVVAYPQTPSRGRMISPRSSQP